MNMRSTQSARAAAAMAAVLAGSTASATDWPQFGYDAAHSGHNTAETTIGVGNVAQLVSKYAGGADLPAKVDGAPVYASHVSTPGGTRDLLFLFGASSMFDGGSSDGTVFAVDAATGTVVWSHVTTGSDQHASSSPAIDAVRQYVYSFGLDGYVHKYRIGDGVETMASGPAGWPQRVTLKPEVEKVASGLTIVTAGGREYLHAVTDGYNGDGGDYQGHLVAIDLASGAAKVFNAMCSTTTMLLATGGCPGGRMSGIWGRGGATWDAATQQIYITTGNGQFNANSGGTNWGDSVLALAADGSGAGNGRPLDSYTPSNYQSLDDADADLGSVSLAILPAPAGSAARHLGVQTGKDGKLRLIDLDDMSATGIVFADGFDATLPSVHVGGELQLMNIPQGGGARAVQPAVWTNPSDQSTWVFVGNGNGLSALRLEVDGNGRPQLVQRWSKSGSATSPVLANGVLYTAGSCAGGTCVTARAPVSGDTLWTSPSIGGLHWQSPIVVDGAVYVVDSNARLWKFGLP
jgi:hypothetical protein